MSSDTEKPETKRGRVRRLLIDRMADLGLRRPKNVPEDKFKAQLDRLTDALTYMSDGGLGALFDVMKSKGQGRMHDLWPPRAAFYYYAELIEPCPLEKVPSLLGWMRSKAGPIVVANDLVVETVEFIRTHKKPPTTPEGRRAIRDAADDRRREIEIALRRIDSGNSTADDRAMVDDYHTRLDRCMQLLADEPGEVEFHSCRVASGGAAA